jgi:hypothetical protein
MEAPKLTHIKLQGNHIGPEGLLALTEAYWPNLSKIRLGNSILTKKQIKLETKDVIILQNLSGIWSLLGLVINN